MSVSIQEAGAAVSASDHQLQLFVAAIRDYAIFLLDPDGLVTTWNAGARALKGYEEGEILGRHISVFYLDEDVARGLPQQLIRRALIEGHCRNEGWRKRKDGSTFWAEVVLTPVRDEAGALIGFAKVTRDLTERKQAEDALRSARAALEVRVEERTAELALSEARYRLIVETTSQGVCMLGADDRILFANGRLGRMLGCGPEELIGREAMTLVHESELAAQPAQAARRRAGEELQLEVRMQKADGGYFWASIVTTPLMDQAGAYRGAVTMLTDISERRAGDEARKRLAAIVEGSSDAMWSLDLQSRITSWNAAASRLFGYTAAEALGQNIAMLCPPERAEEMQLIPERLRHGEQRVKLQTQRLHKNGQLVDVELVATIIVNALGEEERCVIARDLTAQQAASAALQRTEAQLRQAQKMEAVGRLAGGVAHDFNNLLTVILSYASLLKDGFETADERGPDVDEIYKAAKRAAELTNQLLLFSHQQVVSPQIVDLNELVVRIERMVRRIVGEDIDVAFVRGAALGRVRADPGNMEQVIMNLVVNARDAMPTGGRITIETANVELDETYPTTHVSARSGPHVMLSISDTGIGMDKETQQRIFEPFFTTKEKGKGTGLGLSTVFGIVQQHEGFIWVYSEPARGATFKIYLPRTDLAEAQRAAEASPGAQGGSETILLVEDDAPVRGVAVSILRRAGYRVLTASNGAEALKLSAETNEPVQLLLTDVVMPQMSGVDLVRQLAAARPAMKVVCMSGYTDDSVVRYGVLESQIAFLQKPFTPDSLTRKVRQTLDAEGSKHSASAVTASLQR